MSSLIFIIVLYTLLRIIWIFYILDKAITKNEDVCGTILLDFLWVSCHSPLKWRYKDVFPREEK